MSGFENTIVCGDCREVLRGWPECCADAVVTDPPYGLKFMGKDWDHGVPGAGYWAEAIRVAKPGAFLLAFGGTRTHHRLACAIEDAGWEIRDEMQWLYGSGFPKSLDVGKAIDKAAGVDTTNDARWVPTPHPVTGPLKTASGRSQQLGQAKPGLRCLYAPATEAAKRWDGWGTALKPGHEPICLARKPLSEKNVAANVLRWGTGAINVDGCRIETAPADAEAMARCNSPGSGQNRRDKRRCGDGHFNPLAGIGPMDVTAGRWPANVIHDGSEEVLAEFAKAGDRDSGGPGRGGVYPSQDGGWPGGTRTVSGFADSGSAARFFYCAKASKAERTAGGTVKNRHPTVKPLALMQYLCRLVTPPGGLVVDPFCGTGSTCIAAMREGLRFVGIDDDETSCETARKRIAAEFSLGIGALGISD